MKALGILPMIRKNLHRIRWRICRMDYGLTVMSCLGRSIDGIEAIAVGMINFRSLTPNLSIQSQK